MRRRNPVLEIDADEAEEIIEISGNELALAKWVMASWLRAVDANKIRSVGNDHERVQALLRKLNRVASNPSSDLQCAECAYVYSDPNARFCGHCGTPLEPSEVARPRKRETWVWEWVGGGYNSTLASSRGEALRKARGLGEPRPMGKEYGGGYTNRLVPDEKTLRVATERDLKRIYGD